MRPLPTALLSALAAVLLPIAAGRAQPKAELLGDAPAVAAGPATPVEQPDEVVNYEPATPEESAAAIERARAFAERASRDIGVEFQTFETDHFLIFTDWDAREADFLKGNLEGANRAVSKQFNVPPRENLFVGKLPVFMFERQADFQKFLSTSADFEASDTVLGLYAGRADGSGFLTMWKPTADDPGGIRRGGAAALDDARRRWARTLVHEFTHAFLARYKSNRPIPRWLNEGVAELIADDLFPDARRRGYARVMATRDAPIDAIFDDDFMPPGEYYPVMMTMAEGLVKQDRKKFVGMVDAIKAGAGAGAGAARRLRRRLRRARHGVADLRAEGEVNRPRWRGVAWRGLRVVALVYLGVILLRVGLSGVADLPRRPFAGPGGVAHRATRRRVAVAADDGDGTPVVALFTPARRADGSPDPAAARVGRRCCSSTATASRPPTRGGSPTGSRGRSTRTSSSATTPATA